MSPYLLSRAGSIQYLLNPITMETTPTKEAVTRTKVTEYMNKLSKATTVEEMQQIIMEAADEPTQTLNGEEDFDLLLVYSRYRRIKLGLLDYNGNGLDTNWSSISRVSKANIEYLNHHG